MVSVIIPTYGRTKEIVLRAVDSVKKQTYTDWELYVVDDNKENNPFSDNIRNAIEGQADNRMHYIRMENNSGACAARNKGAQVSLGEYLAFLDDDDEWRPERLEKQVPLLEDKKVGFSYCGMWILNEKKNKGTSSWIQFENGNVYKKLLKSNFMGGVSNFIIKRSAFVDCGGFREDMPSSQDYEFWIRLSQKYNVSSLAEDLTVLHIHGGDSITGSLERRIAGFRKILKLYKDDIVKDKKIYSYQLYNLGKFLILNNELKEGFQLLGRAMKLKPLSSFYYIGVIMYWKILRVCAL